MEENKRNLSRTASALKALTYAVPHLSGAIDIVVVRQPDGSVKSSPFYVRFGKYTGLRSQDRRVRIAVNDTELDFAMQLGRTGEVFFVSETEEEVGDDLEAAEAVAMNEALIDGMASPPMGYSDDEAESLGGSPRQALLPPSRLGAGPAAAQALEQQQLLRGPGVRRPARRSYSEPVRRGRLSGSEREEGEGAEDESSPGPAAQPMGADPSSDRFFTPRTSVDYAGGPGAPTEPASYSVAAAAAASAAAASGGKRQRELSFGQLPKGAPTHYRGSSAAELAELLPPGRRSWEAPAPAAEGGAAAAAPAEGSEAAAPAAGSGSAVEVGQAGREQHQTAAAALGGPLVPEPAEPSAEGQPANGPQQQQPPLSAFSPGARASEGGCGAAPPHLAPLPHLQHLHIGAHGSTAIPAQPPAFDPARTAAAEVQQAARRISHEEARQLHHLGYHPAAVAAAWEVPSAARPLSAPAGSWDDDDVAEPAVSALRSAASCPATALPGPSSSSGAGEGAQPQGSAEAAAGQSAANGEQAGGAASCGLHHGALGALAPPDSPSATVQVEQEQQLASGSASPRSDSSEGLAGGMSLGTSPLKPALGKARVQAEAEAAAAAAVPAEAESASPPPLSPLQASGTLVAPGSQAAAGSSDALGRESEVPARSALSTALLSHTESGRSSGGGGSGSAGPGLGLGLEGAVQLSLCWHLLRPGMGAAEVAEVFESHRVSADLYSSQGPALLSDLNLACRLGNVVCRWEEALPVVVGVAAFGPSVAAAMQDCITQDYPCLSLSDLLPSASPSSAALSGTSVERSGSSSWRGWLFSGWRGGGGGGSRKEGSPPRAEGGDGAGAAAAAAAEGQQEVAAGEALPLSQELALLEAAGEGPPSAAAAFEADGVRLGPGGKRLVLLKRRAFVPSPEQLGCLAAQLKEGQNTITFTYGKQQLRAYVYLLHWGQRLVISDIDGTITKSDVLGHLGHLLGYDWTQAGITRLYNGIKSNGYELLFLSSRSIGQASITRDYLHSLEQNGTGMPHGPVIISPDGLFPSLYREVILRRPHEFKIRCLEDIRSLFPAECNPFYAGFGNRPTDEVSYLAVGVPPSKIFTINSKGELRKASTIVRTSTWSTLDSLCQLVPHMFPPLAFKHLATAVTAAAAAAAAAGLGPSGPNTVAAAGAGAQPGGEGGAPGATAAPAPVFVQPAVEREEFNDYNYWKVAPPIVVGSDDEEWGDPEATGGYESGGGGGSGSEDEDELEGLRICG